MVRAVIKVGGAVAGEHGRAVVQLVRALLSSGYRAVLVHGGGPEISAWQRRLGLAVEFRGGRRVTDAATLELVEMVLTGRVNRAWVATLQAAGIEAVGVSGRDGSLLQAEVFRPDGQDLGRVGRVVAVDPRPLAALLSAGYVPVVSPVARDADAQPLNVNGDEAAAALAAALGAELLLLLTDVPGFLLDPADPATLLRRLTASEARARLQDGTAGAGMRPKLEAALAALEGGVPRVQIVGMGDAEALAALAAALAARQDLRWADLPGTAVVADAVEAASRPAPAAGSAGAGPAPAAAAALPDAGAADAPCSAAWIERGSRVLMGNYARLPLCAAHGRGSVLVDADGREYLDFVSGLAVTALGHAHPRLARRIAAQAARLLHASNLYWIPEQVQLAERLAALSGMERWFFCNSGAEANEAAIKLARRFGIARRGPDCYEIVACTGAFHGRTLGALTATGQARYREGFGPLVPGFRHVPFGDLAAVEAAIDGRVCAVLVEPIQGERGVVVPPPGYLRGLRELCDRHGILLLLDEVQTGIGRTGRWFAYQHEGILPDVVTLAKALAGGVPIGAVGARGAAAAVLGPGDHASTFGGNPLACAAALETLAVIEEEGLVARAERLGAQLMAALEEQLRASPLWMEVRGKGLMIGVALRHGAREVARICRERGLLVNAIGDEVIRLLPPLTVTEAELQQGLRILVEAVAEAAGAAPAAAGAAEVAATAGPQAVPPDPDTMQAIAAREEVSR